MITKLILSALILGIIIFIIIGCEIARNLKRMRISGEEINKCFKGGRKK